MTGEDSKTVQMDEQNGPGSADGSLWGAGGRPTDDATEQRDQLRGYGIW